MTIRNDSRLQLRATSGCCSHSWPQVINRGNEQTVDGTSTPKVKWELSGTALTKFLACLDEDVERAGAQYESLRRALIKFFDWRLAAFPEELADEALNRVIRKIDEGETPRDVPTYCHGIARMVLLESLKRPEAKRADIEDLGQFAAPEPVPAADERQVCFEQCLRELPLESRQLILQYYQDERRDKINNRLALAERLGIPLNALRSRAQRLRERLEQCVSRCAKKIEG
jgi:DNA-directed RNA polymerase specialized sigma24 family protein